jgi:hypothetical protein
MFAKLSAALNGETQSRRRRTKSTPVVTELEGRALTAMIFGPVQPLYTTTFGTTRITDNSFHPNSHTLYNQTVNNIRVTYNGLQFTGRHIG